MLYILSSDSNWVMKSVKSFKDRKRTSADSDDNLDTSTGKNELIISLLYRTKSLLCFAIASGT